MTEKNKEHIKLLLDSIMPQNSLKNEDLMVYIYESECQKITNKTNRSKMPKELEYIAEERTAGELIKHNKEHLLGDESLVVKSIKQGDTAFEFTGETPAERLNAVISYLTRARDGEILCLRTIKW